MKRYIRSSSDSFTYDGYLEACDETARWIESEFPQLKVVSVKPVPEEGEPFYGAPPRCGFEMKYERGMLKKPGWGTYFSVDDVFDPAGCASKLQSWIDEVDEVRAKAKARRSAPPKVVPTFDEYFSEVDNKDHDVIQYLMDLKPFDDILFSVPSLRNRLGKAQGYSTYDKCIHLVSNNPDSRTYAIPWPEEIDDNIVVKTFNLTIYDDGAFQFGTGKIRRPGDVSTTTLLNDVYKAKGLSKRRF